MTRQILVVDDESVTRRIVIHALKSINVEVLSAEDGRQALQLAEDNQPELAIVDINLPDLDGFEVIRHLRQLPGMADVPVILFTARNAPDDKHTAGEIGASGFLYKPFSTRELRDLVTSHLPDA
jgi:CheY-like chemotaxis protein